MEGAENSFVDNDITLQEKEPTTFSWVANTPSKTFTTIHSDDVELEYTPDGWVIKR